MNNLINTTGYLNNSPNRFNKKNIIPSNIITMQGVDIPLLLRPNKGKAKIAMPNSGEYKFPKADFVVETPLFQPGGSFFDKTGMNAKNILQSYLRVQAPTFSANDCPEGYVKDEVGNCVEDTGFNPNQYTNKGMPIIPTVNSNNQTVGGTGTVSQPFHSPLNPTSTNTNTTNNGGLESKRKFGTPNIPAILGTNLLGFGLATVANNIEQGRQKSFMMNQMNNPLFNGSYSFAQNDYGVDPYEQTGQLRQYQQGGRTPIYTNNPNDPRLRAYNDSLSLFNQSLKQWRPTNLPPKTSKEEYERLKAKNDKEPFYDLDRYQYNLDKKAGKIKPLKEYVYDIKTDEAKFERNSIYKNSNKSVKLPDGRIKRYILEDKKGNPVKEDYDLYDPVTGTTRTYVDNKFAFIHSSKIQPIDSKFYGKDKREVMGSLNYSEEISGKKTLNEKTDYYHYPIWRDDVYKKPVQPVVYQKPEEPQEPKFKAPSKMQSSVNTLKGLQFSPNISNPNLQRAEWNNTKKTKWSFTYPTGEYNGQKTIYFPDKSAWKEFIKNQKTTDTQETSDYGSAIGYMQMGGKFDPIAYLYGDDEDKKEEIQEKKEVKKRKTPRITDENVDELSLLGLSLDDFLFSGKLSANFSANSMNKSDSSKGFRTFSSYEEGKQALHNQLNLYKTGKTKVGLKPSSTLLEAMSKYAPFGDGANNPIVYSNIIAKKLGITPNTPISQIDTKKWADAIEKVEGNKKGNNPGNIRAFEHGGEFSVDFKTMMDLKKKGIKFKIIE